MKFKPLSNPIMLVSDNPCLPGGLSRMCRDLATLLCTMPQFRVAVLARGLGQNRKLPFMIYDFPESGNFGESYIEHAWSDFAGDEHGIIMTLDDATRRHWLVNPVGLPDQLAKFLGPGRNFQRWMYLPLDSIGPHRDKEMNRILALATRDCVMRFDRVLAASEWSYQVLRENDRIDADWLPHGIWMDKFQPTSHAWTLIPTWIGTDIHVGCVMANQSRKDYPAAFECFAALKQEYGNRFRAWLHVDEMVRYWNVYALANDYGLTDCLEVSMDKSDEELALRYSACDCTILPTAGEGWGYPIAESLACGTACITTDYAAGQELVEESCRVAPVAMRVDTQHNVLRAVISGYGFAQAAKAQIEAKRADWEFRSEQLAQTVAHLDWNKLKHLWIRWLLEGIK